MKKKFYITTSIPYVNADPHIGFAMELVEADTLARYYRQAGKEVYFLSGADENSLKNVLAAEKEGVSVEKFVDQYTRRFIELNHVLGLTIDGYIRTTEARHHLGAQKLWQACKAEDIYKKSYQGLYCVGCEQFYTEAELLDGRCPEHHTVPERVEEENYFFRLSAYQEKLEQLIESGEYEIVPESRKNEALSFIRSGLQDFSISRSQERARHWGVPVPGDPSQVMYVWFDALSSYLNGIGYADDLKKFKKFWPADLHVIGKGILRFHAVYWPAMLLSAGLVLPKKLFVHGYINVGGAKMSKSLGNVVDPFKAIEKYGVEPVRYYLLRAMHPYQDSDFSYPQLEEIYTADLANGLGNLVSRVAGMVQQYGLSGEVSKDSPSTGSGSNEEVSKYIEACQFDQALQYIWSKIHTVDELISKEKPWELAKAGEKEKLISLLSGAVKEILQVAHLLEPFLPETSAKVRAIFTAKEIKKPVQPLFPRLAPPTS